MQYIIFMFILAMAKALDVVKELNGGIGMYLMILLSTLACMLGIYLGFKFIMRIIDRRIELDRYVKRENE